MPRVCFHVNSVKFPVEQVSNLHLFSDEALCARVMTRLKLPVFFFIFLSSPIFSRLEIVVGRSENEGKNSLTDHNIAGGSEISESLENISLSCMDPPGSEFLRSNVLFLKFEKWESDYRSAISLHQAF